MSWFFIALIGPILYSIANHTDKYLISKYMKGGEVGSLIIFSSIFSVVALPIVWFINPLVLNISLGQGVILAINGMLVVLSILCYFNALTKEETSIVVPFYQTTLIFGFIFSYYILGEKLRLIQILAGLIIVIGATILSVEYKKGGVGFKKDVVILMLSASFLYSIAAVLFKMVAINGNYSTSIFWSLTGKVIIGLLFLTVMPKYRRQFFTVIKNNSGKVLALTSLNEAVVICADGVIQYAILLAPVALVFVVNSIQPLFVFIIGMILTSFMPQVSKESLKRTDLIQKFIGITLVVIGAIFLS